MNVGESEQGAIPDKYSLEWVKMNAG